MKIPKEFLIKGHVWTVEYRWGLRSDDGEKILGVCHKDKRVIELERALSKDEKWEVFHHEVGHAICWEAHLNEAGGLEEYHEEVVVSAFQDFYTNNFVMKWKRKS